MQLDKSKFYGTDKSNETSLLEYGLLVYREPHEDGSGTQFCVYRINEDAFGNAHMHEDEIVPLLNGNEWMSNEDIAGFLDYVGSDKDAFLAENLASKLHSLVSYYGYENIFGTDYSPITQEQAIEYYL